MNWKEASPQERFEEAERRIESARTSGAACLDLGDLGLDELPESLGRLEGLRELFLGKGFRAEDGQIQWDAARLVVGIRDLGPVPALSNLHLLSLGHCPALSGDLASLAKLTNLQRLRISSCAGLSGDLSPLAKLSNLQSLLIASCAGLSGDLSPLAKLSNLQSLLIASCAGLAGDLSPLAKLSNLQSLLISSCAGLAGNLSPLAKLSNLQDLTISFCDALAGDLSPLAKLSNLHDLKIYYCAGLKGDLSPLAKLSNLHGLKIFDCAGLEGDLSPLAKLSNLLRLEISYCAGLEGDLSPLAKLSNLRSLEISECLALAGDMAPLVSLASLRKIIVFNVNEIRSTLATYRQILAEIPTLEELSCDSVEQVPSEVLSKHEDDNCLPRLRSYLADLEAGETEETDVKVILLGNGRVGKTQLCRRLREKKFQADSKSTHGVQLSRQALRLRKDGVESTYFANWWDFGGQDIYHSTHSLFLRSRAVFLILWTPELENTEEFDENGIPLRNQPLAYWLDYVRSLAGSDSPVIVVQSKCESFAARSEPPARAEGFKFVSYCEFGAANDHRRETLEGLIHDAIRYLGEKSGKLVIGKGRAELRRRLYEMRDEDQARPEGERRHRTIDKSTFEALCREVGGISSAEHALDYFHQTGVVFHQKGLFGDQIVLDQSWALDAIYAVFDRARAMPALQRNGRFARRDLEMLCWEGKSREEQNLLLRLMQSCGICFVHTRAGNGEHTYLAPDLLPTFDRIQGDLFFWKEEEASAILRLEYRFLHQALLRSLISGIGSEARGNARYWKYGLWLRTQGGTQLLIRQENIPDEAAPARGCLYIAAQGPEWIQLIDRARTTLRGLPVLEQPEETLRIGGDAVTHRAIEGLVDGKVRTVDGRAVDARPFVSFWSEGRRGPLELPEESKLTIDAAPLPAGAIKPEVYVSYAWGDDTPDGKLRGEVVDRLCDSLRGDGFEVQRDRDVMRPGDLISRFIHDIVNAKFVVAIVSEKYLRSPYCMFEIYKVFQACQGDTDKLLQRVLPVVLPEVRLAGLKQRAPYLKHWKEERETAEELLRDLGLSVGSKSYQECRLVDEFARHIDDILTFIQDVLLPRNLETQLADDFEAVRQALKRRIGSPG
jgi:internalin A